MERVLISGGNGFLGSHLVKKALSEGFRVTVVDNLSTSNSISVPKDVEFVKANIEDFTTDVDYAYYIHLAARPSPEDYILHPVETALSNSIGTLKMLEMTKRSNGIFLYASSSETYGSADVIPTPETYWGMVNFVGLRSCYDESKRFSESLSLAFHRQLGVNVRIQRPFNVYGPRIRSDGLYGRVIPRFIEQALTNKDITVHGDGEQSRSFLYVDDWVTATWTMLMSDVNGKIFNIGSQDEISVNNLAIKIKNIIRSNSRIVHTAARVDDPRRRSADIKSARSVLRWEPKINLEEGLIKTIDYMRNKL